MKRLKINRFGWNGARRRMEVEHIKINKKKKKTSKDSRNGAARREHEDGLNATILGVRVCV